MKILDCTLRDGGYYNRWNFSAELVQSYLNAVSQSGVAFIELGLRNFPKPGFYGPFAYSGERFLKTLCLPEGVEYGVMVDAKTILESGYEVEDAVDRLFCDRSESLISLVRIAAHFREVDSSGPIASALKAKGYMVGFNIMQAGGKPGSDVSRLSSLISSWSCVDVLYFADSLGNMDEAEVKRLVDALRVGWHGELGIHTHDNMGRGLANTLSALQNGVTWVDATVTGMGRGAGNTQTERLLAVVEETIPNINPKPVYELVLRHFDDMQKQYGWGSNLMYYLGAQHDVHPTYIQNLLAIPHLGKDELVGALDYLLNQQGTSQYDGQVLEQALNLYSQEQEVEGQSVDEMFAGRELLIVTNASSVRVHSAALELYISRFSPLVVSLNMNTVLPQELVDYVAVTHNMKFLAEGRFYKDLSSNMLLPLHRFTEHDREGLPDVEVINFGMALEDGKFAVDDSFCILPSDLTLGYVLAFGIASGVAKISVAGLDGYESSDPRQSEMIDLIGKFRQTTDVELVALTPTTYPIEQSSVYAFI